MPIIDASVTPFPNLADSRPGLIQRARNYTPQPPNSKWLMVRFYGIFLLGFQRLAGGIFLIESKAQRSELSR
jgi:hypothetical protein